MTKKPSEMTRNVGPLSLRATVEPQTLDEDKRTVDVVWTTGARVMRGTWERYQEELSLDPKHVRMGRLEGGAPLLNAHNSYSLRDVIGVVQSAKLEKGVGTATVRFAKAEDDPAADAIFRKVKDGVIRNVSVGYRVHRLEKIEEEDDKIPVYRATDWEPYEISLVPMGADAGAGTRGESDDTNPCVLVEPLKENSMSKNTDPQGGAPVAPVVEETRLTAQDVERARLEERTRSAEIRLAARTLGLDELGEQHIAKGSSADEFRAEALRVYGETKSDVTPKGEPPPIVAGEDARDKWRRGAADWLLVRSSADGMVADAAKKRGESAKVEPGEFRGMSMVDLARQSLEMNGVRTAGMSRTEIVGRALTFRSGMNSTGDFPVLLENVMHKTLLAAYAVTPDTWSLFCKLGSVSDFRPHNRYRQGSFGRLETVNEHGEFKNKSIPDGVKATISAVTKGNIIAITRQALINDDMGSFVDLATRLGRAARLSIEADVYDLIKLNSGLGPTMSDSEPLFHANRANVGTNSLLSVAGLDADRVVMAKQKDPSGNEILDLRPSILLVAVGLGGAARSINDSAYDTDQLIASSGNKLTNAFQKPNSVRGLFTTIVDTARLDGARRYLLADPAIAPTFEVAFLDGQQAPYLERQEGWRVDGSELKVRIDYGVAAVDFRGAVTNAGTE